MTEFTNFISENMYIVVAVLYVIGVFMKKIPSIKDWTIPFVLTAIGIVLAILMIGVPSGIIQGILCAGGAVLANQMFKQALDAVGVDSGEKQ